MARITCEGSSDPEVQADPLEAAMPSRLSISKMLSPSIYSNAMFDVLGKRFATSPVTKQLGTWATIAFSSRSRIALTAVFSNVR